MAGISARPRQRQTKPCTVPKPMVKPVVKSFRDGDSAAGEAHAECPQPAHQPKASEAETFRTCIEGLRIKGRRTRYEKASIMVTTSALNSRETSVKPNTHVSSTNGPRERRHRRSTQRNGEKDSGHFGKLPSSLPLALTVVPPPKRELKRHENRSEDKAWPREPKPEDTDSCSDLSDTERDLLGPPSDTAPPQLHLRAEIINPHDFRPSRPTARSRFSDGYPDFLPPPFNSWSLRQLAVYLNTDGRGTPRPRPVGQLERYLERLLQLEWRQIQTIREESSKAVPSSWGSRHRPHTSPHSNLSAPKSILQCQRAFPLALLSSLANTPPLQPPSCTCPSCRKSYPICNGACRLYTYPHHSHLSPLTEKRGKVPGVPRRSSSESRAQQFQHGLGSRSHRLSDPLDSTSHLKRMQAIGNIRNPAGCSCSPQDSFSNMSGEVNALSKKGERSRSCGDVREDGLRRVRAAQKTTTQHVRQDSKSSGATSSDDLHSSKDSVMSRPTGKQKHVEFVPQQ